MKKFSVASVLTALFLSFNVITYASDEVPANEPANAGNGNEQLVEVENTGALLLFQKQPVYERQIQVIRVKKSGAICIFQINGKIKDFDTNKN